MDRTLSLVQPSEQPDSLAQANLVALLRAGGAAREQGARFHFERPARGLRVQGGRVTGVETDAGLIETPLVVIVPVQSGS